MMTANEKIKYLRKKKGWTMDQLAEKLGVTQSLISRWESSDVENMRMDNLKRLAEVLDVNVTYFLYTEDELIQQAVEEKLVKDFRKLDKGSQAVVLNVISTILESDSHEER